MGCHGIARAICTRRDACWWLVIAGCFLLMITCASTTGSGLIGDHVCQREQRYTVNVTEYFLRNVTVRSFKWCMQVPPRCSTFTHGIINDSRIVEEENVRQVNVCCDGFIPNLDGEKCEPICTAKCNHGQCNDENKCYCKPGFRGEYCETSCDSNRWGRYCRYHCECQRGTCNPEVGTCICPSGWTGLKCDQQCQPGHFGLNCSEICACHPDQICSPQDGTCTNKLKMAVFKKYHTFDTPYLNTTKHTKKIDMYLLTTPKTKTTTATIKTTTVFVKSVANNVSKILEVTTEKDTNTSNTKDLSPVRDAKDMQDVKEVNIKSMNRKVTKSETSLPSKGKAYFASASVDSRETVENVADAEVVTNLENFGSAANASAILNASGKSGNHDSYGLATISFLCIVAVATVGVFIATRFLKLKQKEKEALERKNACKPTQKSIFHTPLPEPPQSPFFETPPCAHYHTRIGDNNVAVNPRLSFTQSLTSPRSQFLSYIDESTETEEISDVFYDQLPSTRGTYKATAAPEPPPSPTATCVGNAQVRNYLPASNEANKACASSTPPQLALPGLREFQEEPTQMGFEERAPAGQDFGGENLYDEIPCWTRSTENDALYINTRVENKTQF